MEVKVSDQKSNPLLHRTEVHFIVTHPTTATPKRDEVRGELAKLVKVPKERLVIEWMRAKYGTAETVGEAAAYETKEALESIVREHILVRNGLKAKVTKGPPAEPSTESPPQPSATAPAEPAKEPT
ncbi:MAG: 30S ribosomal protein S24e [Thermoplasmata archaeon]